MYCRNACTLEPTFFLRHGKTEFELTFIFVLLFPAMSNKGIRTSNTVPMFNFWFSTTGKRNSNLHFEIRFSHFRFRYPVVSENGIGTSLPFPVFMSYDRGKDFLEVIKKLCPLLRDCGLRSVNRYYPVMVIMESRSLSDATNQ